MHREHSLSCICLGELRIVLIHAYMNICVYTDFLNSMDVSYLVFLSAEDLVCRNSSAPHELSLGFEPKRTSSTHHPWDDVSSLYFK